MQNDEYLRTIAWATVQMLGRTVKVVVVPSETAGTFDVHAGLLDGTSVSFKLTIPWEPEAAEPDQLRDHVRDQVRKWQVAYLADRQAQA